VPALTRSWCVAVALVAACSSPPRPVPPSTAPAVAPARILVLGDIQLGNAFKEAPSLSTWRGATLDTRELRARLAEALRDTQPTELLQMGDLVDLNESAVLALTGADGRALPPQKQPLEEWKPVLALFPSEPHLWPVVGNHERYGELTVSASLLPDGDHVEIRGLKLTKGASDAETHAAMLAHFPWLERATFHGATGSYAVSFPRFCLVSFDGADLDGDPTLFGFLDARLRDCAAAHLPAIVANHYPLFSGRPRADDASLELAASRDRLIEMFSRHRVAIVLSGHEHFYLRYLSEGRRRAGYPADLPPRPVYMTVSDFANPYSRAMQRLDPDEGGEESDAFRYFRGTHYAEIVVNDTGIEVTVRGYRKEAAAWETIDSFELGR
jgi:hypothetical protein